LAAGVADSRREVIMPQVQQVPERTLADCALRVAESRSLDALGTACRHAIGRLTGSSTFGLYWLNGDAPKLFVSADVPDGFLADYRTGLARCDPFVDSILDDGQVVDGLSLIGAHHWPRSIVYDLLRTWGFGHDMCGPLRVEDRIVGVFYTGLPHWRAPYNAEHRQHMEVLCRASSLALTNMIEAGMLDDRAVPRASGRALPAPTAAASIDARLPPRAAEVARLVCRGRSNKEIARDMGISDQTVKDHVASLCRRFGALNRTELAARLQNGLLRQ
jgi:DNA-binding CsgD family transcriptional regulator